MEYLLIPAAAFLAAILTFFSGFGLGTLLTPVFLVFFPADLAIALTGVVHFFNNLFKLALVGRHANRDVLLRFGIPAILASLAGAWLLLRLTDLSPLFTYSLAGSTMEVYPVKFVIALLLVIFASMDLIPYFGRLQFGRDKLPLGGALSGFFGGLSGNQGALRSAFLIRAGLSKKAFIGTAVVVSTLVDVTRLGVYATRFVNAGLGDNLMLVALATLSAIAGAWTGHRLLKKVTLHFLQIFIAVLLILLSLALGAGIL
ncbi:MAG: sulfite exporter TauE/SafE family protein [Saprospiraceae bacterium]|nr:sulfite exporter TauE/SafE family protein [Saprospiraceae bacterium]